MPPTIIIMGNDRRLQNLLSLSLQENRAIPVPTSAAPKSPKDQQTAERQSAKMSHFWENSASGCHQNATEG